MAGGVGSRFWPMSRTQKPKQFLDILNSGKTLLQATYDRFLPICPKENIYVVTNDIYTNLVTEQLPELLPDQILSEPSRKNTAPCVAYAAYKIGLKYPNANLIVTPADHFISKTDTFLNAIAGCLKKSEEDHCLLTIGIKPTRPDTGYGYIQYEADEECNFDKRIKKVKTFTEKPNLELAKSFLESGDFLWNSGIFIFTYNTIREAFENFLPEIHGLFLEAEKEFYTDKEKEIIKSIYNIVPSISIDYGIMEKADNVWVRASLIGWSDLGTWGSLLERLEKDAAGNSIAGKNILTYNTENTIVKSQQQKLIVIEGLKDYIVVENEGMLLICSLQNEQLIKTIVNDIQLKKGEKFT
jgi:mannose-1-phosphate guanylyltransferase